MGDDVPMFDGTPLTRRELLIAREAWVSGRGMGMDDAYAQARSWDWHDEAARRYPLPKITRQREVRDEWDRVCWKSDGCNLYWTLDASDWHRYPDRIEGILAWPNKERVAIWTDLLANPCEEVEVDE